MSERLLEIRDLHVAFASEEGEKSVVHGIDFHIEKGETLALVGESGSGKSVSALSIPQLLPYPAARHPAGSVLYKGEELMGAAADKLRQVRGNEISMIFQEPMTSLNPLHTIEKQIGEAMQLHRGLRGAAARARTLELLDLVGIQDAANRLDAFPHQLSGGQRQRVMIAMALANEPELLIADEPTTALDVTIQAQILNLLKELQEKLGMAILLITHDLNIVRHVADRVCVMTDGEIVETGPVADIFENPQHDYTRKLLFAQPSDKPERVGPIPPVIMEAESLKVWFPIKRGFLRRTVDHVKAVDGITVAFRQGRTVGVVGESGSGKTTLAMALLRLIGSEGSIKFDGQDLQGMQYKETRPLRQKIQIVFQDPFGSLSPRLSIAQIIEEGLLVHKLAEDPEERRALVAKALEDVELEPAMMDRYPHEFSGGQRQRIAIARALVLRPQFLVLDEPTSALDVSVQAQVVNLLRRLQDQYNLAYLFISHDLKVIRAMADEIIVMRNGLVVEQGQSEDIFEAPKEIYTKALIAAAFDLEAVPL